MVKNIKPIPADVGSDWLSAEEQDMPEPVAFEEDSQELGPVKEDS